MVVPMIVSGVLIQVLTAEGALRAAVWVHLATGLIYLATYAVHQILTPSSNRSTNGFGLARGGGLALPAGRGTPGVADRESGTFPRAPHIRPRLAHGGGRRRPDSGTVRR